ncbi:MAG: hypothetical protein K2N17_06920 [Clostridia bacterium]|nr:hypothetical protein [Clostridia bacterium]
MEENENKTVEVTEEAVNQPSREEILAMSREENKNGDEKEKRCFEKASALAFSVGLLIAAIILIVTIIRSDRFPSEIMFLMCGMQAVQSLVVAHGYRKMRKVYLAVGIFEVACAVFFLVFWILQLCGVVTLK